MTAQDTVIITPIPGENDVRPNYRKKRLIGIMVGTAIVRGLLWINLLAVLFVLAPCTICVFVHWNVDLPELTRWTLNLAFFVRLYWYLALSVFLIFYTTDLILTYHLYRKPGRIIPKLLWKIIAFLIPLCLLITMIMSILLPLEKLTMTLS